MINIDYTLILVILNFVVLLAILHKLLYKPIQHFLEERQKKINEDMDAAHASREEAAELATKREQELKASSDEIRRMKQAARREADHQAEEIVRQAKEHEKRIAQQTEEQMELERKKAMGELQGELADMVAALSEKFLNQKLNDEADTKIIEQMVQQRGEK